MLADIKLEGTNFNFEGNAEISVSQIICVCPCGQHDNKNATIEFNFRDKKVYYTCSKCHKINDMQFGEKILPLPQTRM